MSKLSTYGPKPRVYVLEGERYYVGADVGNYLKCHRGKLYKHYPNMWRRVATPEEKRLIHEMNNGAHALSSNVMLVRCDEVDEIFAGNDEKYRAVKGGGQAGNAGSTPQIRKDLGTPNLGNRALRGLSTPAWMSSSVIDGVQVESVSTALPISAGKGRPRPRDNIYDLTDQNLFETLAANAAVEEELVPIRLDLEFDGIKVRDAFCYNKNETIITPEIFAEILCDDLEINNPGAVSQIANSMRQQIAAYEELLPMEGAVDQRAQIKLNVNVQNENLTDTIEWDIAQPENSPEEFANVLCKDLQIGGEFLPAIAYSIRGQLAFYRRTFAHSDSQLPTISGLHPIRSEGEAEAFCPALEIMSDADLEKRIRDSDRNTRRMRRINQYGNF